jgi:hypothetical protein
MTVVGSNPGSGRHMCCVGFLHGLTFESSCSFAFLHCVCYFASFWFLCRFLLPSFLRFHPLLPPAKVAVVVGKGNLAFGIVASEDGIRQNTAQSHHMSTLERPSAVLTHNAVEYQICSDSNSDHDPCHSQRTAMTIAPYSAPAFSCSKMTYKLDPICLWLHTL